MWNDVLESAIISLLCTALLDHDYHAEIVEEEGDIFIYAWPAAKEKPEQCKHWIKLIPGNNADMINDYTTNLSRIVKQVEKFTEFMR